MNLPQQIEAILFWKAEPVTIKKLSALLSTDEPSIRKGIETLVSSLQNRGITLVQTDTEVTLGTAKEFSSLIEQLTKEELVRDLGKAGLETLSIILYQGPISRADIDYIRGVNSQFIIRNLLVRGLVERIENPTDARSYMYRSSIELLSHLGLSSIAELPEYDTVRKDIEAFKQSTATPLPPSQSPDATID
ncbi:MAG: SMC-Scp complex subunit ScpB [Patescibacteria group bacterium]